MKLFELEVENFRSIRGRMSVPLDAQVVLMHGENGAGKTSLLSAIELALTGQVQALRNADANYRKQLVHRAAEAGWVAVQVQGDVAIETFGASVSGEGCDQRSQLDDVRAAFFTERSYLPQALLGQLLQIYQNSGTDADSPLARFVARLLGLHRLDALEGGLKPVIDVRNLRKVVSRWSDTELEVARLDRTLAELEKSHRLAVEQLAIETERLSVTCRLLEIELVAEDAIDALQRRVGEIDGDEQLARVIDKSLRLDAILRETKAAGNLLDGQDQKALTADLQATAAELGTWREAHAVNFTGLRERAERLFPHVSMAQGMADFRTAALALLRPQADSLQKQAERLSADNSRMVLAHEEREVAAKQLALVNQELEQIAANSAGLGAALAEITGFIDGNICPVCERDFSELGQGSLILHVHEKVRRLSGAGERLLDLSRVRSERQLAIEALDRELAGLEARRLDDHAELALSRRSAEHAALIAELETVADTVDIGDQLERKDIMLRRRISERDATDMARRAARETLNEFAREAGQAVVSRDEGLAEAAARLGAALDIQRQSYERRLSAQRDALSSIEVVRARIRSRDQYAKGLKAEERKRRMAVEALGRAQALREDAQAVRSRVDGVRSAIIRREFNDRLNRVWRDLFVRLAPGEPFVPAFSVPKASTKRLQPKLVTHHRDGGRLGGTPGAMLSAGNLNTAALTLFLALHLAVPVQLPWLILDDPVQSMDDVHVAHLAALLKTLSKQHARQVIVAVHDRQLFEYLKLELSPAQPDETLLAIELYREHGRDTQRLIDRLSWKEETALRAA